jgi:hypothetical protein
MCQPGGIEAKAVPVPMTTAASAAATVPILAV